jgi:hypothetical protein
MYAKQMADSSNNTGMKLKDQLVEHHDTVPYIKPRLYAEVRWRIFIAR